jgi:hypothetical protein
MRTGVTVHAIYPLYPLPVELSQAVIGGTPTIRKQGIEMLVGSGGQAAEDSFEVDAGVWPCALALSIKV